MCFVTFINIDLADPVNVLFLLMMLIITELIPYIDPDKYETGYSDSQAGKVDNCINRLPFRSPIKNQKVAM